MNEQDGLSKSARHCANCRYLSFTAGQGLRCADPASAAFDRAVSAKDSCARFQLSFSAAKRLAFRNPRRKGMQGWEIVMHQHLAARDKSDMQRN